MLKWTTLAFGVVDFLKSILIQSSVNVIPMSAHTPPTTAELIAKTRVSYLQMVQHYVHFHATQNKRRTSSVVFIMKALIKSEDAYIQSSSASITSKT